MGQGHSFHVDSSMSSQAALTCCISWTARVSIDYRAAWHQPERMHTMTDLAAFAHTATGCADTCTLCAGSGELHMDCKASRGQLAVPEDTSAVAHGDVNIDVTDFLKNVLQGA